MDALEELLQLAKDVNLKVDRQGRAALHLAASSGSLRAARLLLEASATVDAANYTGSAPLLDAARAGHVEVARALLEARADKDRANKGLNTPLSAAALGTSGTAADMTRLLLEARADLRRACAGGQGPSQQKLASHFRGQFFFEV